MQRRPTAEEFKSFYFEHNSTIRSFVFRRVKDFDVAEDIVAEVFLTAWKKFDHIPHESQQQRWLRNIAFHLMSNDWRARGRRERLKNRLWLVRDAPSSVEDAFEHDGEMIRSALKQLGLEEQLLLERFYWERLSYRVIASNLGISENAVAVRLNRARRNLRNRAMSIRNGREISSEIED
jgi:RNA polymerase sigma-70 factor, ECF subfamily